MRVLIADDEPLARSRLQALLAQCRDVEVLGSFGDAQAALAACVELKPDLILLDIRMPGLDGLQLAQRLSAMPSAPRVVFCTAFDEYAVDAYDVRAVDYLLKPFSLERLQRALQRVRDIPAQHDVGTWLHARVRGELRRINLDDVLYLVAEDKYVNAQMADGTVLLEDSLKTLELQFPDRLLRLHRNCLVPRERLLGIKLDDEGQAQARIAGCDQPLEISRRNLPAVRRMLRE